MKFNVRHVHLHDYHGAATFLDESEIEEWDDCPVCRSGSDQRDVALAEGNSQTALKLTQCAGCTHLYLSRHPSEKWLDSYYANEWDNSTGAALPGTLAGVRRAAQKNPQLRRAARAARVLRRDLAGVTFPGSARLLQMVAGLGDVDGDVFPTGKRLLEIGSGLGAALGFFREMGLVTVGTEASAHRVEVCRSRGLDVVQTTASDLTPVADRGPFDLVYSSHVVEHIADVTGVVRAADAVLTPGGFLYIQVPNALLSEDLLLRTHIPVHLHLFTLGSVIALMRSAGLHPVRFLVDHNLHVIAQKANEAGPLQDLNLPAPPEHLIHGLKEISAADGEVQVRYDQFRVDIIRLKDKIKVYSRSFPYGQVLPDLRNRKDFTIEATPGDSGANEPIRFLHESEQAPIWVKKG